MKLRNNFVALLLTISAVGNAADVPEVSNVIVSQAADRLVTITYNLSATPAVVTLDIETNCVVDVSTTNWVSIGGANIQKVSGDVWKRVEIGSRSIYWHADISWPDHKIVDGGIRAVVTAWALDNTPNYMVVDIAASAKANTQHYYPSVDFIPGGLLGRDDYRTTSIVMRKIMAKGVAWTMGSTTLETQRQKWREVTHKVELANNYYIGVFPVTQAQWDLIQYGRSAPSYFSAAADRAMRPVEQVSYNEIRNSLDATEKAEYNYPANPNPISFLGKLRTRTGIDFDLPSEAQWEFAARAGNGDTKWGDGSGIMNSDEDANLGKLGRYQRNGGRVMNGSNYVNPAQSVGAENGTAIVGSYLENDWGLYDTFGNVWEWCLDWYSENITGIDGKTNIDLSEPNKTLVGGLGSTRIIRGGGFCSPAGECRPAYRYNYEPTTRSLYAGFRLVCTAGLQ